MSKYAFPDTMPIAEFQEIAQAIKGGNYFDKGLLLPAWVVQGYVAGKIVGTSGRLVGSAHGEQPLAVIDDAALATYLDQAADHRVGSFGGAVIAMLPWRSIALALAKFTVKILES